MRLNELTEALKKIGVCEPKDEARIILEHLFGTRPTDLLLHPERDFDTEKIEPVLKRREEKIPIQYIIGKWYFMGLELAISEACLIPRPDTEILVYEALKILKKGDRVADFCTGSGCIGLSVLKHFPDVDSVLLLDISRDALSVAEQNAKALGVTEKCTLVNADITKYKPEGKFNLIISNPPYILSEDMQDLSDEVKKEPTLALDGGEDGLDIIRVIIDTSPDFLDQNGALIVEFGFDQGDKIRALMNKALTEGKYKEYKILKDYGGNDRALVARK